MQLLTPCPALPLPLPLPPILSVALDEEDDDFMGVDSLQAIGVHATDIAKLRGAGLCTVGQVLATPTKALLAIKGISDAKVEKVMEAARKLKNVGFVSGVQALRAQRTRQRISTGCKALDAVLGGGVETGAVTELFGEFRTGKTQILATLCVNAQLDKASGGAAGKVIVIDTENAFRVERIAQIAEARYGLDPAAVLDNVTIARALTHEHQAEMVIAAAALITGSGERYKLLVLDSIIGLFRTGE